MAASALSPVAEAVYARLQDATLLALLAGGVHSDVPQTPTYPFCWVEVQEPEDARGFGTGGFPRVGIRTHVFSQRGGSVAGVAEAQECNRQIVALLKDYHFTVDGYVMADRSFWLETVHLPDEELNGVKVHEIVAIFDIFVEET